MNDYLIHLIDEFRAERLSRRELLRRASVAGFSLAALHPLLATHRAEPHAMSASTSRMGSAALQSPRRGGTLRIASAVPSADPQPVTASNGGEVDTFQPSLEYLCWPRANWTLEPRLATSWKADPDPKTWVFTIRQGVRWHDGSPLTTDDVVATFERLVNPSVGSSAGSVYHGILSYGNVEKVSDTEVRFHLDVPFVDFPTLVSGFAYQSAILPKDYQLGDFTKGGVGTGPFVLKSYTPQQQATYTPNRHYWRKSLPYLHGLTVRYYQDDSAVVLAMQAGDVDLYPVVPLKGAEPILKSGQFHILRHSSADYRSLHMRVDRAPFSDKRVRQAVALCLNRTELVKTLFNGAAQVGNDHSWAPIYAHADLAVKDIPQRKQNYAKAKALLSHAGYRDGFSATLTTENLLEMSQYAVAIKQYLAPAKIKINLNVMTTDQYYGSGSNQPWLVVPFGMTDWAARGSAAQAIVPEFPTGAEWNSAHWSNPDFDKAFAAYNSQLDNQKRNQLALQCARIQHDEVPVAIGYWIGAQRATTKRVHGLAAAPDTFLDLGAVWMS